MAKALYLMASLAMGCAILEALVHAIAWRARYDWRAAAASLAMLVGYGFVNAVPLAIALPGADFFYAHRLLDARQTGWASYAALLLSGEFLYYWHHRLLHRCRWFWTHHAVHHSANQLNFATAFRLGWTSKLTGAYVIFIPLTLLGFPPETILRAYSLNLVYQFWLHSAWIPRLGPFEGILNTPSAHRVHHAANPEYLDSNFGGALLIFDRLFGTYRAEREEVPCRYGLTTPLHTNNPLSIAFHQFGPLFRDLRSARSLGEAIGILFGPMPVRVDHPESWPSATAELRPTSGVRPVPQAFPGRQ
jgi:sterol desaturase/sphingolipid hydroxylase (fatty acid hydroxylase superfamily)